jgi:hypothetical protein
LADIVAGAAASSVRAPFVVVGLAVVVVVDKGSIRLPVPAGRHWQRHQSQQGFFAKPLLMASAVPDSAAVGEMLGLVHHFRRCDPVVVRRKRSGEQNPTSSATSTSSNPNRATTVWRCPVSRCLW